MRWLHKVGQVKYTVAMELLKKDLQQAQVLALMA